MANRGVNKVILIGNLGQDPDIRYMPSGSAIANITLATSESWRDKGTGEIKEQTEWHRIVLFGKLAEIASEYLRKGSQVYIEGHLRTRKWTDQSGQDRYTTEVLVNANGTMQMLGNRQGTTTHQQRNWNEEQNSQSENQFDSNVRHSTAIKQTTSSLHQEKPIDFDDEIPF